MKRDPRIDYRDEVTGSVAEILARYPFDPAAQAHELRGIEKLRAVPDHTMGYRAGLVGIYLACQPRWIREETKARGKVLQAQSREHLDKLPPDESERKYP